MHYYSHHIGDFVRDTANLDDHQLATYLRMLWSYYDSETSINGELEDIAFAMRSDEKTVRLLLRHYFTETPEGWRHTRCDKEIQAFHAKQDKAKKSANARWSNANAMRPQSERNASESLSDANQEPITNNQEKANTPRKPRLTTLPEGFRVSDAVRAWALEKGFSNLDAHFEHFRDAAIAKGYRYADWDRALQNAVRSDWAGLNKPKPSQRTVPRLPADDESVIAQGAAISLVARPGESMEAYRIRVQKAVAENARSQA